jgi:hypothetical protein
MQARRREGLLVETRMKRRKVNLVRWITLSRMTRWMAKQNMHKVGYTGCMILCECTGYMAFMVLAILVYDSHLLGMEW